MSNAHTPNLPTPTFHQHKALVFAITSGMAGCGRTQRHIVEHGFIGVKNMSLKEFWEQYHLHVADGDLEEMRILYPNGEEDTYG